MPRVTVPRPLSKAEARRIWLHAQRLDTREPEQSFDITARVREIVAGSGVDRKSVV